MTIEVRLCRRTKRTMERGRESKGKAQDHNRENVSNTQCILVLKYT